VSEPTSSPGWKAHALAALVTVHLLAVTLQALPAPSGGEDRRTWADPTVQAELDAWHGRLGGLLGLDREGFEDGLYALVRTIMGTRRAVLAPFDPYYRYAGTWQSWRMFVAPHRYPARLEIAVREAGQWRVVYLERDPDAAWMADLFDHDRARAAVFRYSWPNYRRSWDELVDWLAPRVARDFPNAERARFRFLKGATPTPEAVRAAWPAPPDVRLEPLVNRMKDLTALRDGGAP
jgi:hypothetical protein